MGERSRATTIADVAVHAGVSQASVSRVLNGKQSVDPTIVRRVQASIAARGVSPSGPPPTREPRRTHIPAVTDRSPGMCSVRIMTPLGSVVD